MSLSRHINAEEVIEKAKEHPHLKHAHAVSRHGPAKISSWSRDEDVAGLSRYTIPAQGVPSRSAYQLLHDEMNLDGNPTLNLASFVHTWMPEEATKLMVENINKNIVDQEEYPAAQIIHNRCVSMIADLWKAPKDAKPIGTATAGSSEAIMMGGLALKKRWQEARKAAGKDYFHPNIIFGSNCQVALEKFARYFDVELRLVPVKPETNFVMNPHDALQYIDENTIGIMVILGSTYTGHFEDVQLLSNLLDNLQKRTGLDIPIHVDAASGGFLAPFAYPHLKWSFEIPRVVSINTSGHKFGLVYVGIGWILWRDEAYLPKDLIFELHYLGGVEYSYTLNFSKPAAPVIGQMFNFLNLGFEGFKRIAIKDLRNARMLSRALDASYFKVLSSIHRPISCKPQNHGEDIPEHYVHGLPVVAFAFSDKFKEENPHVEQKWIQTLLKTKGWIVPNYNAPEGTEDIEILRVVVRESFTEDMTENLITDIIEVTETLKETDGSMLVVASGPGVHRAEKSHGRPNPDNFGRSKEPAAKQSGYSRAC